MLYLTLPLLLGQSSSNTDIVNIILGAGGIGVAFLLVLIGKLWPEKSVLQIIARAERAEKQRDEMLGVLQDIVPALKEVNEKVLPVLRAQAEQMDQREDALARFTRVLTLIEEKLEDSK